ncbi:MAG: VOC family protein [Segniliparus sp.]|uniref:VOC family protein n=1 Tax=Segniliparus sp. TaxID=2804064 RepID=UPI003F2BE554
MTTTYPRPINHIGISVPDIDKAIEWYAEVLGYRLFAGPTILDINDRPPVQALDVLGGKFKRVKIAHLSTGYGTGIELFQSVDPSQEAESNEVEFYRNGIFHICVTDPNIEDLIEKIVDTGGSQISRIWDDRPPLNKFKMVYCRDPFGTIIEIHTHSYEIVQSWR